jgi:hypothetical protein
MTRKEARKHINSLLPHELTKAPKTVNGYDTYICPFCNNGGGNTGDGICTKNGKHYKCFVCDFYGDYLDMLMKKHGTTKEWDIFTLYGLTISKESEKPLIIVREERPPQPCYEK